ncbi:agarase [Saccharobesus litoralis]|uniref:Agarase n=1 Tax=Saccharobesus litoralis TaxID=2172099 RepID=A0A2S0VXC1_9ALTE|nr:agarase [Saccharobesus litoralis]
MSDSQATSKNDVIIDNFATETLSSSIKALNAQVALVNGVFPTSALKISFKTNTLRSGISIKPQSPWQIENLVNYAFKFDVKNTGNNPVMLTADVTGANGQTQRRSIGLDVGETAKAYFDLAGFGLDADFGMRDLPPSFKSDERKMIVRGGKKTIDFSQVFSVKLYTETQINANEVVVDNLRIASTGEPNTEFLTKIVDKFGQRADIDFPLKVKSESELRKIAAKELKELSEMQPWPERSQFGGWKQGPKLAATGYFRTEKVGDKWAMVDPEGYLYFSTGIANARMSNTSTFTGIDYKDDSVRYIDPNDVTPEDSQGIGGDYREAQKTHYVSNATRRNMFEWLPDYDSDLAEHYGYRRKSHRGPIKHGEVYSFYQANLERRYGESSPRSYLEKWREVTLDRMQHWGFTSFGNWTDPMFYDNTQVPYFANGWIIGDFKKVSSGADFWGAMPDPFDPEFVRRAKVTTKVIAEEIKNSPWCVGVFIDNEMSWGGEGKPISRYGIVIDALSRNAQDSPTKAEFVRLLKNKYKSITQLSDTWQRDITSWQALADGVNYKKQQDYNQNMLADFSWLLEAYADEYFRVVKNAIKTYMPNHMYMGARFTSWNTSPEARWAAKKHVDVMSYNYYREGLDELTWGFLKDLDMPTIIGEFHFGSDDTGNPHPGIILASSQQGRAAMYKNYMATVIDNPTLVGAHWFQYIDSPITGRAHDGENYNVGFVTTTDIPYPPLVEAAQEVNRNLYQRRFGQ